MKLLFVSTNLDPKNPRYERFVKLLSKHWKREKSYEIAPGMWLVRTDKRPNEYSPRLMAMLESEQNEHLVVTTIAYDNEHFAGWLSQEGWDFLRES